MDLDKYRSPSDTEIQEYYRLGIRDPREISDAMPWTPEQKRNFAEKFKKGFYKARDAVSRAEKERKEMRERNLDISADAYIRGAQTPIIRDISPTLRNAGLQLGSLAMRPFDSEAADVLNREVSRDGEVSALADRSDIVPDILQSGARGAMDSVLKATALSPLGPYGIIGGFAVSEANSALTEAKDAGLTGKELRNHVGRTALIEGGVAGVFQLAGIGGLEKLLGTGKGLTRSGFKAWLKHAGKATFLEELPEEVITEITHGFNNVWSGVDPEEMSMDKAFQILKHTTVQTVMSMGATSSVHGAIQQKSLKQKEQLVSGFAELYGWNDEKVQEIVNRASNANGDFSENLGREVVNEAAVSPMGLAEWAIDNPEKADVLAQIEKPTRRDFREAGLPDRPSEERQRIANDLREILVDQELDEPVVFPEEAEKRKTAMADIATGQQGEATQEKTKKPEPESKPEQKPELKPQKESESETPSQQETGESLKPKTLEEAREGIVSGKKISINGKTLWVEEVKLKNGATAWTLNEQRDNESYAIQKGGAMPLWGKDKAMEELHGAVKTEFRILESKDLQPASSDDKIKQTGEADEQAKSDTGIHQATGSRADNESDAERPAPGGSTDKAVSTGPRGVSRADSGGESVLRPTKPDADSGLHEDELPPASVGVERQRTADNGSRGVSGTESGKHGVVPVATRTADDGTGRTKSSVADTSTAQGRNFDLRDAEPVRLTKKLRKETNAKAKGLLFKSPNLTDEDKEILRQYTGEGGLSSGSQEALNQHYTDYPTIRAIFRALHDAGVKLKNLLEPAVGSGNFVGHSPESNWTTVDIDETNHKVVKALYPQGKHYNLSFEEFTGKGFDAIISNVPFLETRGAGRRKARPDVKALHDFYFLHALDLVNDDGVIAFVTSKGTMDKLDPSIRKEIVSKADVIGAFRLPSGTFSKNAHTDVITDIIFLHKRPEGVPARKEAQAGNDLFVKSTETNDGIALNEWYQAHPQAVLGELVAGIDKLYGGKPAYEVRGEPRLEDIAINYQPYGSQSQSGKSEKPQAEIPKTFQEFQDWANENNIPVRFSNDSHYAENVIIQDGVVYAVQEEVQFEDVDRKGKVYAPVKGDNARKILALNAIREKADEYQAGNESAGVDGIVMIDEYKKQFKKAPHKDRALKSFFKNNDEQTFFSELSSSFDENFNPAEVFQAQTRHEDSGRFKVSKNASLKERAVASEDNKGIIDFSTEQELISDKDITVLLDSGYALVKGGDKPVLQNEILYYSGNIYKKLNELKQTRDTAAPEMLSFLDKQNAKLREIMPTPKTVMEINIKGTESWFLPLASGLISSSVDQKTGMRKYKVSWSQLGYRETKIFEKYLNNQALVSRENNYGVQESTGSYMRRMREAEGIVQEVLQKLKDAISGNESARNKIEFAYNSRYRNYVKPDYQAAQYLIQDVLDEISDNAPKTRNPKTGKMIPLSLRKNQIAWVVQALYEGKGINAHDVGGGKTMAAIVLARVLKRRGRAQKPMFTVPAKTIKKWVRETKLLFPDAKVLDLGNLSKNKREKALFDLANSNYDYVFISHEGFEQIKLPADVEGQYAQALLDEHIDDPEASGRQEALIKQKMDTYKDVLLNDGRDTRLTWDKLGVDCIIADEAHAFKNIGINNQLQRYGLGKPVTFNKNGTALQSARAYDFRFKSNYTTERNNGNNVFLLTATPTPNAPMEVYTMLRHLGRDIFKDYGISNDRDFVNTFFRLGTGVNVKNNQPKHILKAIVNAQELRGLLNRYVDKVNMEDMPWITIPGMRENKIILKQSPGYAIIGEDLIKRQKNLSPNPTEGEDTLVSIYTGGRSGTVDPRLYGGAHAGIVIDSRSYNSDNDKMQWTIETVAKVFKNNFNAGQLIFLDDSGQTQVKRGVLPENLHREFKSSLVAMGFKPEQVAIINGTEITNMKTGKESSPGSKAAERKIEIQDAYNKGQVKVVIGSTKSMGEGMDLQVKTTDIYHLDIPYTPGEIRQRNGRGLRPGNENDAVNIHYLMMQGSFDATSLNLIQTKKGWNEAIWDKDIADEISTEEEMSGGTIPSSKQMLIDLEHDPVKKKRLQVDFTLESLHAQLSAWKDEHYASGGYLRDKKRRLQALKEMLSSRQNRLNELEPDDRIKDEKSRTEQFERSKAYAQKLIQTTERQISEGQEAIDKIEERRAEVMDNIATMTEDIKAFEERWFTKEGESKVTEEDIGDDPEIMGAPITTKLARPVRQVKKNITKVKPTQAADIVKTVKKLWPELSIKGIATFKKKKYAGWYNQQLGEIRQADVRDIAVTTHELGHHFDRQLNKWSKSKAVPAKVRAELVALGQELYGNTRPPGGYKPEGFAEFIRKYLLGEDVQKQVPELHKWFTTEYLVENSAEARKLQQLEDVIAQYQLQSSEQAVRAFRQPLKQDWSMERFAAKVAALEGKHRDSNLPVLRAMQETGADLSKVRPSDNPYMLLTMYSRTAGGRALHSVLGDTVNLKGQKNGIGLRKALESVADMGKEHVENWTDYAIARRSVDLHERGINPGIALQDAQKVVEKYQSEVFDKTLDDVTEWSRRMLHLLVEAGVMTESEFASIEELNPVYVPFSRQFEDGEIKQGRKHGGRGVYRIKGSGREIHNPIDALIVQSEKIMQTALQADALRALVRFYDDHKGKAKSLGKMMSEVSAPLEATTFSAEQIKKEMATKAVELGADPGEVTTALMDTWDEKITVFTKGREYKGKDNIISVVIDGNRRFFEVKPELVSIIENITNEGALPGKLGELSRKVVGLQRLGATGLNPAFGLLRNPLRDTLTAAITSDYHFHVPILSTIRGSLMDIANSEEAQMYHALGLDISGWIGQDMKIAKRTAKRATAVSSWQKFKAMGPISGLREILSHSEVGPRLMEFQGAYKYGMDRWGNHDDAAILAACAAKDITVNFSRAGSTGRAINEVILFYNAAVQSVDKLARSAGILEASPWAKNQERHKTAAKTIAKGAMFVTLAAVMNYLRNRDEEWWKELPPHEKWGYIHTKLWDDKVLRVPLPFEAGAVFGALPVAVLEETRTPGAFKEALTQSLEGASPIEMGSLHNLARNIAMVSPIADIIANQDWKGADIVPTHLEDSVMPQDQYGPRTSSLAKMIGSHVPGGYSPAKIDHLLNGYTGNLYNRIASTIGSVTDPSGINPGDPATLPLFGTLFLRLGTSRVIGDFYDRIGELKRKQGSGIISLTELGELKNAERISRKLRGLWAQRRDVITSKQKASTIQSEANSILDEAQTVIRDFQIRDKTEDKSIGLGYALYTLTSPSADAEDKAKYQSMIENISREEMINSLKQEVKRRGGRLRARTSSWRLTAYGKRLARLRSLNL